ncbi:MAG: bifunctional diaminohydroxyphosphoribosylaminopyrimidine deaminase/5-amino-6-(5-phosphoribosylamino)uracil reductase RibD [Bacillota bacterium]
MVEERSLNMFSQEDKRYMTRVFKLARMGEGYTSPNPLVGAVVVKNGEIIGEGYHAAYGEDHAEVMAIDKAGPEVVGSELYVNLEPCCHYGKTPPCSLKIINSGIKRVVVANRDTNPKVAGGGLEQLKNRGVKVEVGLMAEEGRKLNEAFFHYMEKQRPFYNLKAAQTIDGYIAAPGGDARWISGKESRKYAHGLRHKLDAILIGSGTAVTDDPRLTVRHLEGQVSQPTRVVLDSNLKISEEARLFREAKEAQPVSDIIIFAGPEHDMEKQRRISALPGVEVIEIPYIDDDSEDNSLDLNQISAELVKLGLINILVEGGSRINYSFLKHNLIDKYYLFISPKILGGDDGISVFSGSAPTSIAEAEKINIDERMSLGDDILIIAYPD